MSKKNRSNKPKPNKQPEQSGMSPSMKVALVTAGSTLLAALIPIFSQRDKIQKLEAELLPYKTVALEKFGSIDAEAMRKLFSLMTNTMFALSNLQTELALKTDPKTYAAEIGALQTRELISGSDTNSLYYYYETNGAHYVTIKLASPAIKNSINVSMSNGKTSMMLDGGNVHNIVILKFFPESQPLPIAEYGFAINYAKDLSDTNFIENPRPSLHTADGSMHWSNTKPNTK